MGNFKLWLENANEEMGLLRNVIENRRDAQVLNVFADWLEDNGRPEAPWIRAIAQGQRVRPSRYVYAKYVNGLTIGMKSTFRGVWDFVRSNSSAHVNIDRDLVNGMRPQWDEVLQLSNVNLYGTKVRRVTGLTQSVTYYHSRDVWMIQQTMPDSEGYEGWYAVPATIEPTPTLYWMALYAVFHFDGIIN